MTSSLVKRLAKVGADPRLSARYSAQLNAAAEILANSHLVNRLSPSVQGVYPRIRGNYPMTIMQVIPDENQILLTFKRQGAEYATAAISATRDDKKLRVTGTSEELGSLSKLCRNSLDIIYQLNNWLDQTS